MALNTQIALSFFSIGLLTIAISVPLVRGKVKRNHLYGIRTPKAFESDELWFKINRHGGQQMILWGVVLAVLGLMTPFLPFSNEAQLTAWFSLGTLLSLIVPGVQIFRYSKRL